MDCKSFKNELPDLLLTPGAMPSVAVVAHLKSCPPCTEEYVSFQQTFDLLKTWPAVEPTAFFDGKLHARVREAQRTPAMGWMERLQSRFLFNTGRSFRPMLAGALGLVLAIGGGSVVGLHSAHNVPEASATVNDLQILDRNEQAFHQLDELQQDDDGAGQSDSTPQSPTT